MIPPPPTPPLLASPATVAAGPAAVEPLPLRLPLPPPTSVLEDAVTGRAGAVLPYGLAPEEGALAPPSLLM